MTHQLLEPFITAASVTLREMAGLEAVVRTIDMASAANGGELSAYIVLTPATGPEGWLGISFSRATATTIVQRIVGEVGVEANEELILDCAGELANVCAGQAKTLLLGTPSHFSLSIPTLIARGSTFPSGDRWVIHFATEAGELTMQVRLPGEQTLPDSPEGT